MHPIGFYQIEGKIEGKRRNFLVFFTRGNCAHANIYVINKSTTFLFLNCSERDKWLWIRTGRLYPGYHWWRELDSKTRQHTQLLYRAENRSHQTEFIRSVKQIVHLFLKAIRTMYARCWFSDQCTLFSSTKKKTKQNKTKNKKHSSPVVGLPIFYPFRFGGSPPSTAVFSNNDHIPYNQTSFLMGCLVVLVYWSFWLCLTNERSIQYLHMFTRSLRVQPDLEYHLFIKIGFVNPAICLNNNKEKTRYDCALCKGTNEVRRKHSLKWRNHFNRLVVLQTKTCSRKTYFATFDLC